MHVHLPGRDISDASTNGAKLGVLSGIAVPEDLLADFHYQVHLVRRPYHGQVLKEDDELKGRSLLNKATLKNHAAGQPSAKWSLAEDLLNFTRKQGIKVFGVVCFRSDLHSFACGDERRLDATYQYLFERIDQYMRLEFAGRHAKLVFDDRGVHTNAQNAKAITNFFGRSSIGRGYDTIVRSPMFATSQGHNYGLQMADLVTTVIGLRWSGKRAIKPLYGTVHKMLYMSKKGGLETSSLKIMR